MSYQSVHFWILFSVPLFTPFSIGFVLHSYKLILLLIPKVSKFVIDIHYKDKPKMQSEGVCPIQQHIFRIEPKRTTLNQNVYDRTGAKGSHCDDY